MQANAYADTDILGGGIVESSYAGNAGAYPDNRSRDAWPDDSDEVGGAARNL